MSSLLSSTPTTYKHLASFKKTPKGIVGYGPRTENFVRIEKEGIVWAVDTPKQTKLPFRILTFRQDGTPIYDTTWVDTVISDGRPIMRTFRYEYGKWEVKTPSGGKVECTLRIYKYFGNCRPNVETCHHYGYECYYEVDDVTKKGIKSGDAASPLESLETPTPPRSPTIEDIPTKKKYEHLYPQSDIFSFR